MEKEIVILLYPLAHYQGVKLKVVYKYLVIQSPQMQSHRPYEVSKNNTWSKFQETSSKKTEYRILLLEMSVQML